MSEKNLEIISFMETRKERSEQDGKKLDDYDMKRYCPNDRVVIECEIGDLVEYIQTVEELKKKYVALLNEKNEGEYLRKTKKSDSDSVRESIEKELNIRPFGNVNIPSNGGNYGKI